FEEGFDGAVLEVSGDGGATWTDLGPQVRRGGYNGVLVAPNPIAGRRAWTGSSAAAMTRVVVDLERWAGAFAQVRFRATSDASVGGAGWYIDRVEVCRKVREEAALSLDRPAYSCQGSIHLRILDTGRAGLGQAQVELSSGSDPGPKLFDLQEVGPNTGVFEGEVPLVAEDGPGALIVKEGDEVRAVYRDADGGGGDPREAAASAVVDCAPPAISAVALEEVGESSAVVRWETDEDAFGRVEIGLDCAGAATAVEEGAPRRAHRVVVAGLEPGTVHAFRVACRDRAGNSSVDDAGGACHGFRTRVLFCPFEDDLEPAPAAGWDGGGPWRHEESPHARSAPHAWRIQGVGRRGEASLTLPVFRSAPGMVLELFHTFELATGLAGGVIEGSTDGGSTWTDLEGGIVEGAYAGFLLPGNPLEGRRAWTGGRLGAPARVRVRLDALGEGDALVRLRLASQGIAPEGEWIVDDFKVCRRVGESGVVGFGEVAYACGAAGTAFAADAELTGSALVALEVTSSRQVEPLLVQAAEVLPGFFRGSFAIAAEPAEGAVLAADGDALTVTYRDARDESGAAAVVERSAPVDCVRPRLLNLRLGSATFSTLEVLWETSEPAHGRVRYGESCDNLDRLASSGHLVTMHAAVLGGLAPEAAVELRIEATDLAGNATLLPECIRASIARRCELEDSLEPPVDGWTHSAAVGPDDWSLVELDRSHSPTRSWHAPNPGLEKDASLVLPRIEAPEGAVLSFWHTYQLEAGFDGAVLEVSDDEGLSWQDLGPEIFLGGYTDLISTAGGSIPGWTGGAIGDMTLVSASLAKHAGPKTRVRFRILCDDSVGTAGWYLDDVSICTFAPAASASRFARGNCNADEGINLSDAIFLLNHLFLGGAEPTCPRACDSDSNDALNLTDAVYLLDYLFRGGPPMAPPAACDHELEPRDLECAAEACAGG
ncbi:MAG: hypothetical protein HY721_11540, partial [Planctomycetes bacterium]|nr:hypothetical protein [Planctomycetota bacterium]